MSDQFVAEIRIFGFNFPPTGWAHCNGQLMPLSQNTALFSLLGTTYGGDGKSTFALPNIQGDSVLQHGQGPGLSQRFLGQEGGSQFVTLLESEIPVHSHALMAVNQNLVANVASAGPTLGIARSNGAPAYTPPGPALQPFAPETLAPAGGSLPHNNLMPYLTFNFCIALQGIFPQRP